MDPEVNIFPKEQLENLSPEDRLREFIDTGLELVRQGRYLEGRRFFFNRKMAESVGLYWGPKAVSFNRVPSEDEVKQAVDIMASYSHSNSGTINIADFAFPGATTSDRYEDTINQLPPSMLHNLSLIAAEEWIHGLQYLQHGQDPNKVNLLQEEIEVAVYLKDRKVPMTDEFLDRYGRRQVLKSDLEDQ